LTTAYYEIIAFSQANNIRTYEEFRSKTGQWLYESLKLVCENLQEAIKQSGDWQIYPFGVHDLIAKGRVAVEDRTIFIDGKQLPAWGYRLDDHNHS